MPADESQSMNLSPHFTLEEMTLSQTAVRRGIDNTPPADVVERLRKLCVEILEPARAALGPLKISSGYRSKKLNVAVGGSTTSAHCLGYAADVLPLRVTKMEFARWVKQNCKFDQLILEFGTEQEPAWIHISCDPRNRGQVLRATSKGYSPATL